MKNISILTIWFILLGIVISYEIVPIPVHRKILVGEFSHWDSKTQSLYFVDLLNPNATICRYDYKCNNVYCANIEGEQYAASIIPLKRCKNQYVVGIGRAIKVIRWNGLSPIAKVLRAIFAMEPNSKNLINHVESDPTGRLYFGTYGKHLCASAPDNCLYSISKKSNRVKTVLSGLKTNTGFTWNAKENKFYHLDGCSYRIDEFDWNPKTGNICNRRTVFTFDVANEPQYLPSGLSVDCCGNLYTALYGSYSILKIDPRTSCVIEKINMPVPIVTSPIFGGSKMDELFVTSGTLLNNITSGSIADLQPPITPLSGSVLKIIKLASKGSAGTRAKICIV